MCLHFSNSFLVFPTHFWMCQNSRIIAPDSRVPMDYNNPHLLGSDGRVHLSCLVNLSGNYLISK